MSRNRRNVRRRGIKYYLNMRTFITIVLILLGVIVICLGVNGYRRYEDKRILAKQKEELDKQSEQIFLAMEDNINKTNKTISETDEIIHMSAVGDILCGEEMLNDGYSEQSNTYNFSHMFSNISDYINEADIVMGTMETNFTSGKYTSENAPIEFAKAVKDSGINLVTISHNHSLDLGIKGLKDTKESLKDLNYDVYGDKIDGENAVMIKSIKNTNIAFLTYTYGVNNQKNKIKEELNSINIYSEKQVKSDIEYAKEKGAEYICVLIHWGDAFSDKISSSQRKIADFLVDNGVDLILGAHPSVVQPMEVKENRDGKKVFVAYSIGTYIANLSDDNAKIELVLNIELKKSGEDGKVYLNKVDYTPIYVLDNGKDAENRFELIDLKKAASDYATGSTNITDRVTYDKWIKGLNRLDKILTKRE